MNWAGLGPDWQKGQAADGTGCTRQSGAASQSWGQPALPCPAEPDQQTLEYRGTAGFPAARPARPNRLQLMGARP